ncbi:MAG: metallophosphoesterase [Chloroflexaceae bacterium]|nr:metallophosphoesterase [Chloroflexaceae bacterium]
MSAANFQKVEETVGMVDAIFYAGDMVDYPHRASEWFDRFDAAWLDTPGEAGQPPYPQARPAFFPAFQGKYQEIFPEFPYTGGALLQHAALFGTIGNHEAPGRWRPDTATINEMDNDPQPRWYAEMSYEEQEEEINPSGDADLREQWIRDHSYEFTSYFEVWSHPDDGPQGEAYYAYQIGDVFLISMNVSRVWRDWEIAEWSRGKFTEQLEALNHPDEWGFGDMWFETFDEGSEQYDWLVDVLESDAFANARYRVVMAHQSAFGLGDNVVPALADPVVTIVYDDTGDESTLRLSWPVNADTWNDEIEPILGTITEIRYEYPVEDDVWLNDIEPLLLEYGVDLVLNGHSHVWNRAEVDGMHYLETSNVGNTFGAYYADEVGSVSERASWATSFWDELDSDDSRWDAENYPKTGDVHGREPVFPTEFNPMEELDPLEEDNRRLPFVSSNNLTVFSILDTGDGTVSSYVFDTRDPEGEVQLFDQFGLGR